MTLVVRSELLSFFSGGVSVQLMSGLLPGSNVHYVKSKNVGKRINYRKATLTDISNVPDQC